MACGHTEPFTNPSPGSDQPFDPTPPARLTLNPSADRNPAWLPDGSGILYSAQQTDRPDRDVCLALLPPSGGSQRSLYCDVLAGAGVTDAIETPAASADGRLAFVAARSPIGSPNPSFEAISLAVGLDPATAVSVRSIPYTPQGGPAHGAVGQIHWLNSGTLVYLGEAIAYRQPCLLCPLDTIVTGLAVTTLDVETPGSVPSVVPGTEFASGVSPGGDPDQLYYTVGGDTRVFRRTLSTSAVEVAFDFAGQGIARDVQVAGTRLVATVGGRVAFSSDPSLGPTQWDSGGVIHLVDLLSGSDTPLPGPGLFRHPALSPAGDRVVAEGYSLSITRVLDPVSGMTVSDTTVGKTGDLYLFTTP